MDVRDRLHKMLQGTASESDVKQVIDFMERSRHQQRALIPQAFAGQAKRVAKDRTCHPIMCQIVDLLFHEDIDSMNLIHELVDDVEELCEDPCGRRVIHQISVLEANSSDLEQNAAIAELRQRVAPAISNYRNKRRRGG